MRKLVIVITLVLLVFGVSFSAPRKIVMWSFAANNLEEWKGRKAEIEKKFDVELDLQLVAQNAFVQRFQAVMMDQKDVPDIIEWLIEDNRILNADPKKSLVYPLDNYVKASKVMKGVIPGRVSWLVYGGHTYGLPHDCHPVVLIYNDTLWKSVGVDVAKLETWDQFFEAGKKLVAEQKDGKPVHYALPYDFGGLGTSMWMMWVQSGANFLDKSGKPIFTSPEFKSFVSRWLDYTKTGEFITWDWGNFAALLKSGTLASYCSPDWWVPQVNDAATNNGGIYQFKARPLPLYKKGGAVTSTWGGSFLAIPKTAKDPDFLWKMLEYMQYDAEGVRSAYKMTGMLKPYPAAWVGEAFDQPDPRFGGQKLAQLQIQLAKQIPQMQSGDIFWDAIHDFNQEYTEIAAGKESLDDGLKKAQDKAMERIK